MLLPLSFFSHFFLTYLPRCLISFVDNTVNLSWHKSGVWDKVPEVSTLIWEMPKFPHNAIWDRWMVASTPKNQLDSSSCFDTVPACDRETDGRTDGHTIAANMAVMCLDLTAFVTERAEKLRRNELVRWVQEEKEEGQTRGRGFMCFRINSVCRII